MFLTLWILLGNLCVYLASRVEVFAPNSVNIGWHPIASLKGFHGTPEYHGSIGFPSTIVCVPLLYTKMILYVRQ